MVIIKVWRLARLLLDENSGPFSPMTELLMFPQRSGILVSLVTERALEEDWVYIVLLHVLAEVAARYELFATHITGVGFLSTVDSSVSDEVTHLWECTMTYFTLIRLGFHVNAPLMLLEWRVLDKAFTTIRTNIRFLSCVCTFMLLQCLLAVKSLVTARHLACVNHVAWLVLACLHDCLICLRIVLFYCLGRFSLLSGLWVWSRVWHLTCSMNIIYLT